LGVGPAFEEPGDDGLAWLGNYLLNNSQARLASITNFNELSVKPQTARRDQCGFF
jgi:hypothetical protein